MADLDALIDDLIDDGAATSTAITERLLTEHGAEVHAFVGENVYTFLRPYVTQRFRLTRLGASRAQRHSDLDDATDNPEAASRWLAAVYAIDEDNNRKRLADMTGTECGYVAETYEARSDHNAHYARVFRILADVAGRKHVKTMMTEAQLKDLFGTGGLR